MISKSTPKITAIIITKNEEEAIESCLKSISWVNEIIVIDSGSKDQTVKICKAYKAKVVTKEFVGFGKQKNIALSFARHNWIISIDADEIVTAKLKEKIISSISMPNNLDGFFVKRVSYFCGKKIRFSGWGKEYVLRVFRKDKGHFSNDLVHEKIILNGNHGIIHEPLEHRTIRNIEDLLDKLNRYTTLSSLMQIANKKPASLSKAIFHSCWAFLKSYFFQLGFLDGQHGFVIAIYKAENSFYRYVKTIFIA
jgi:glycosyltransferase involved in cell wall biosynthesis